MSGLRRLRVAELHPNLLCILCGGYYVDATTIVECLHSFCKTCIVRYLESSKFCPICDVQVHKTKPLLSIRPDKTLQDIVYKLVPGLYQNEMCRRRDFYTGHPDTQPVSQEDGGSDVGRWYILPDDPVSLAIYPAPPVLHQSLPTEPSNHSCPTDNTEVPKRESMPRLSEITKVRGSHVRYLQCPAGVSVAQLKRLLRAKFGVGPSHPMALLTCSSDDPLNDTLTLVDVAYITSWQRTEPLQLLYRIYERASKKIKLDPESFIGDTSNLSEDMPKLEPNVGTDLSSVMCSSSESGGSLSDYRCAPLLQAVGVLGYHLPLKNESSSEAPMPTIAGVGSEVAICDERSLPSLGVKQEESPVTKPMEIQSYGKESPAHESKNSVGKMTQSMSESSGDEVGDEHNLLNTEDVGNSTVTTYTPSFTTPSNGVNVGITFVPGDVGCTLPAAAAAAAPCAIIPSEGCIPVSENCVSGRAEGPASNASAQRHANGGMGVSAVNNWSGVGPKKETEAGTSEVKVPSEGKRERKKGNEEEGKEVQLKISESGVMSVCGHDTTMEGVITSLQQTEACELLSKIESEFPVKDVVRLQKHAGDSSAVNKKIKLKDIQKAVTEGPKSSERVTVEKAGEKGEKRTSNVESLSAINHKSSNTAAKETKAGDKPRMETGQESGVKGKPAADSHEKVPDKRLMDVRRSVEQQYSNNFKESCGNGKDGRSSHIPASLTAASLANLNKPHLKAGPSKAQIEEDVKTKEKPSNNGLNTKKEGKQEQPSKTPTSGCRKSSQPYGYKTLKTPPKSWNPTISREHMVAGKSSIKGNHEAPRTNKFFKARNAPRFLGNPNTGVRSLYSGTSDSNICIKRTIASKLDPKSMGSVTVPARNDASSLSVTPTVSGTTACVSSVQSLSPVTSQATVSPGGPLATTTTPSQMATRGPLNNNSCTAGVMRNQNVVSEADNVVSSTKAPSTLPAPLASGTKESTNQSSKVCFNTNSLAENKSESKSAQHNNGKTVTNYRPTSTINNSSTKNEKKSQQVTQSSSKPEVSIESTTTKTDTKVNSNSAVMPTWTTVPHPVTNTPVMMQQKAAIGSTNVMTCMTQTKPATVNSLTIPNTVQQPQQHLALAANAVGVGIIPSCGVTFPAAIGNLPLPCHTSSSISYPTYPYMYQGTEPISLIPPHPSAPFIPTFPTCLPHRPALSPRSIGTKMMPELSLQPNLLPMVPLVPQVPPQALSPRPMTPPSPRTPTSSQSPRPYPAQSPRQSSTSQSRPLTPQSPKQNHLAKPDNPAVRASGTPPLASNQSVKLGGAHLQGAQTVWPAGSHKQVIGPGQAFSSQPNPQSPGPPPPSTITSVNTSLRLNASVQTSSSHTLTTPKTQWSSVNSSKPVVPQSSKSLMVSLPGLSNTHTATSETNRPHTPQSPKSPRPNTPQSPRLSSSTQCTVPQVVAKLPSGVESPRPHTPHARGMSNLSRISSQSKSGSKEKMAHVTESPGIKRSEVVGSEAGVSCGLNPPVITPSISFAPAGTTVSSGALTPSITSSLGNKFILPQGAQVALPLQASFAPLYLEGVTNTLPITLANPGMSADLSGAALSPSCNTSLFIPSSNITSSMPFIPFSNSAQLPIPTYTTASVSQSLCPVNTTVSPSLNMLNTKIPAIPINNVQSPKPSVSGRVPSNNLSNISAVAMQNVSSFIGTVPTSSSVTLSTPSGAFLPLPCSTVSAPVTVPRTCIESITSTTTASIAMSPSISNIRTTSISTATGNTVPSPAPASVTACLSSSTVASQHINYQSAVTLPLHTSTAVSGTLPSALPARAATNMALATTITTTNTGSKTASTGVAMTQSARSELAGTQLKSSATADLSVANTTASQTLSAGSTAADKGPSNIVINTSGSSKTSIVTKSTAVTVPYTQTVQALPSGNPATASLPTSSMSAATVPAQASMPVASKSSAGVALPKDNPKSITNSQDLPPDVNRGSGGLSAPVHSTAIVSGPQTSECFSLCGTVADGNTVVSVKEKGGSEPQLSACTSVCDVTHVIDAKQPCAEQGLSSSGGPRPCLKS